MPVMAPRGITGRYYCFHPKIGNSLSSAAKLHAYRAAGLRGCLVTEPHCYQAIWLLGCNTLPQVAGYLSISSPRPTARESSIASSMAELARSQIWSSDSEWTSSAAVFSSHALVTIWQTASIPEIELS